MWRVKWENVCMSEQTASSSVEQILISLKIKWPAMFDDVSSRYDVMNALLSGGMNLSG